MNETHAKSNAESFSIPTQLSAANQETQPIEILSLMVLKKNILLIPLSLMPEPK